MELSPIALSNSGLNGTKKELSQKSESSKERKGISLNATKKELSHYFSLSLFKFFSIKIHVLQRLQI